MRSARTDRPSTRAEARSPLHHWPAVFRARRRVPSTPTNEGGRALPLAGRYLRAALGILALLVLLVGCATGNAQDAQRGRQRDATRADVLPNLQATLVAHRFAATPAPAPTRTPIPTLESLVLSIGVGPDGSPQQSVNAISSGQPSVYATALIHDLLKGEKVIATWRAASKGGTATTTGPEVAKSEIEVNADTGQQWFAFPLHANLQPGTYAVVLTVNDQILNSLVFQVTG